MSTPRLMIAISTLGIAALGCGKKQGGDDQGGEKRAGLFGTMKRVKVEHKEGKFSIRLPDGMTKKDARVAVFWRKSNKAEFRFLHIDVRPLVSMPKNVEQAAKRSFLPGKITSKKRMGKRIVLQSAVNKDRHAMAAIVVYRALEGKKSSLGQPAAIKCRATYRHAGEKPNVPKSAAAKLFEICTSVRPQ